MDEAAPTVIVARRVKPGCTDEMRDWHDRLLEAATEASGYLGSLVQPPDEAHPDEWVTIYRFAQQADLDGWLRSDTRAELMKECDTLVEGAVREQRIAQPNPDAVTAVMSKRVSVENLDEYRRAQAEINFAMSKFPGFIRAQVSEPVPGIQEDHITVFSFDTRARLDDWLASDERTEHLKRLDPLTDGGSVLNVVEGFSGWFGVTSEKLAPLWKQAVTVLMALYPTTLTLAYVQSKVAPDLHWIPAMFVSNVLGIAILTWVLMPIVTKALAGWLKA